MLDWIHYKESQSSQNDNVPREDQSSKQCTGKRLTLSHSRDESRRNCYRIWLTSQSWNHTHVTACSSFALLLSLQKLCSQRKAAAQVKRREKKGREGKGKKEGKGKWEGKRKRKEKNRTCLTNSKKIEARQKCFTTRREVITTNHNDDWQGLSGRREDVI